MDGELEYRAYAEPGLEILQVRRMLQQEFAKQLHTANLGGFGRVEHNL